MQPIKQAGGGYNHAELSGTSLPPRGGYGKLGIVSQRGGASFEAELNFSLGSLAIGHLRSYSSVGSVNIVVLHLSSGKGGPVSVHINITIDARWKAPLSLYSLSNIDTKIIARNHNVVSAMLRVTSVPGAGPFTLYTISAF